MATKTVVCPECDAPLSPGRFACASCGALVAAVATVSRSFTQAPPDPPIAVAPAIEEEPPALPNARAALGFAEPLPPHLSRVLPPVRRAASPPRADKAGPLGGASQPSPRPPRRAASRTAAAVAEQAPLAWVLGDRESAQVSSPPESTNGSSLPESTNGSSPATLAPVSSPEPAPTWPTPPPAAQSRPSTDPAEPSWPAHPTWPPPRPADVAEPVEAPPARVFAGAYLPPSAVLPPGELLPIGGPGRARAGAAETDDRPVRERVAMTRARLRLGEGTGPLGMPVEVPLRIVVLGAGLAGLGFLLPWAQIVIGSGQIGGYLAQWGLAGPGHVVILALIVGLALLALFAERLPRWVRLGLPSIGLACLLTGLIWPYLVGPYDASIGVYVVAVGAVVMIAGGLLDRVATRHAEASAGV